MDRRTAHQWTWSETLVPAELFDDLLVDLDQPGEIDDQCGSLRRWRLSALRQLPHHPFNERPQLSRGSFDDDRIVSVQDESGPFVLGAVGILDLSGLGVGDVR